MKENTGILEFDKKGKIIGVSSFVWNTFCVHPNMIIGSDIRKHVSNIDGVWSKITSGCIISESFHFICNNATYQILGIFKPLVNTKNQVRGVMFGFHKIKKIS